MRGVRKSRYRERPRGRCRAAYRITYGGVAGVCVGPGCIHTHLEQSIKLSRDLTRGQAPNARYHGTTRRRNRTQSGHKPGTRKTQDLIHIIQEKEQSRFSVFGFHRGVLCFAADLVQRQTHYKASSTSMITFSTRTRSSAYTHLETFQDLRLGFPKRPYLLSFIKMATHGTLLKSVSVSVSEPSGRQINTHQKWREITS